jgi:hypothetical protein
MVPYDQPFLPGWPCAWPDDGHTRRTLAEMPSGNAQGGGMDARSDRYRVKTRPLIPPARPGQFGVGTNHTSTDADAR